MPVGEEFRACGQLLAEGEEVEVDGDGVAFGGSNEDGGRVGVEDVGGEIKLDGSAGEGTVAVDAANVAWMAMNFDGREKFVAVENLHLEVAPEVVRPGDERGGGAGTPRGRRNDERAVGIS